MRKLPRELLALALAGLLSHEYASGAESEARTELDEVTVHGMRLRDMPREIDKAEERFFQLYSELNEKEDLDIRCHKDKPTGSRIPQQICKPVFFARAQENLMQNLLARLGVAGSLKRDARLPMQVMHERFDELVHNLAQLLEENPELMQLLEERNQLEDRYKAARKRR
jgi:hypothetical protein